MKDKTTITVTKETRNELMMFKINTKAKNLDQVIQLVLQKLKEELGDWVLDKDPGPSLRKKKK